MSDLTFTNIGGRRQRGIATLAIGVLLLTLITMVVLFGARVTILEQRISANEYRAKEAFAAAEAGLNIAIEFVKANRREIRVPGTSADATDGWQGLWSTCTQAKCPYVWQSNMNDEGTFYYLQRNNAKIGLNGLAGAPSNTLDNGATFGVDLYLCQVQRVNEEFSNCADPSLPISPESPKDFAVLITSHGISADGSAEADVAQIIATYPAGPTGARAPIIAASTIDGTGTFDIVANPNGGGPGVPLSIWSGDDFFGKGDFMTCELDEYLSEGSPSLEGTENPILVCRADNGCQCTANNALSGRINSDFKESLDVVDNDPNYGDDPGELDYTMDATNFPDDLFLYIFGVPKEDYLQIKALADDVLQNCKELGDLDSGFYWVEGDCSPKEKGGRTDLGSPDDPMLLVVEGDFTMESNSVFFGLIYTMSCDETCAGNNDGRTWEGGAFNSNGTVRVYGSLISDHQIDHLNGTFHIVFNQSVLDQVQNQIRILEPVPGSWTDMLAGN